MRRVFALAAALVLLGLGGAAQATVTIETVAVGDAGNLADTTGYGSVGYDYNIGKYEVTAGQYTEFLNAVAKSDPYELWENRMPVPDLYGCMILRAGTSGNYSYTVAPEYANRPVNWVSLWDACRFTNWLSNGQGTGDTETGTYTLNGYQGSDGRTIQRNTGWTWAVTSEEEWYKAAYYKGGGTSAGYWLYPTCSDNHPGADMADVSGNNANVAGLINSPGCLTEVGEFQNSDSPYGTFDQGGNILEWTDTLVKNRIPDRRERGGSFRENYSYLASSYAYYGDSPSNHNWYTGFRVCRAADSAVPEPMSIMLGIMGLGSVAGLKRLRGR